MDVTSAKHILDPHDAAPLARLVLDDDGSGATPACPWDRRPTPSLLRL